MFQESIIIGGTQPSKYSNSTRIVEKLGRYCPLLKILKGDERPNTYWDENWIEDETTVVIGDELLGLSHLELIGNNMSNYWLNSILDGCSHLELLGIRVKDVEPAARSVTPLPQVPFPLQLDQNLPSHALQAYWANLF